jgi:putative ABC transport system ATP-binding protein
MPIVELSGVHKTYPLGQTTVHAVRGVSFQIDQGEFVSIVGPSGSGKSTILNMIGCIDTPTDGVVSIAGTPTNDLSDREITDLRHRVIGFIFQSFNLVPVLNVYENVEFPLLLGSRTAAKKQNREWVQHIIHAVGLEKWTDHRPTELSGGQRQRVAIARALATRPKIVLADEPTANLDSKTGESILDLMRQMNQEVGTTFVFSTHDPAVVNIADHVVRLLDGSVIEDIRRGAVAVEA